MAHPLAHLLGDAANGVFPAPDGTVRVLPALSGRVDAMIAFTGSFALAAGIDPDEVAARVPTGDFSVPMSAAFLMWVGERIGSQPGTHDVLLVARAGATPPTRPQLELVDTDTVGEHPRVRRATRYRHDTRAFVPPSGGGVLVLGRGLTNRWELAFEVDEDARGAGLGRALARAALTLLPPDTPIWAQVAPGNAASLRAVVAAGFRPVGAEVLFATRA